jgi:hypothetical protein
MTRCSMALVSRSRQQWLCDAVKAIADHLESKRMASRAQPDDEYAMEETPLSVLPFDLSDVDIEEEDREGLPETDEDEY